MIPPVLQGAALSGLENLINKALQLDPATSAKLQALDGQRFSLELKEPDLNIGIGISGKRLRILGQHSNKVTTRLSGRWSDFAKVATATDPAGALINGDIRQTFAIFRQRGAQRALADSGLALPPSSIRWN